MKPIEPSAFWGFIKSRGINFVSGVPDSTFKATYDSLISDDDIKFVSNTIKNFYKDNV